MHDKNNSKQPETLQSSASERLWYMPKAAAIHYINVCQSDRSRPRLQWLPYIYHSAQ